MSRHKTWVFSSRQEALEYCEGYRGHPYVSVGSPIEQGDRWIVEVTFYDCD